MPKRKRLPTIPLITRRPTKKRKKSSSGDLNSNNTNNKLSARFLKKQIIPKAALQFIDDPVDHLLFFNLLSKNKRPQSSLEWELMSQSFTSKTITAQTLRQFYSILVDHASINDPHFVDDDEDDDIKTNTNNQHTSSHIIYNIDLVSDHYQNAHTKFMEKLHAFIQHNDDNDELQDESINAKIFEKDVDLFYLYLLVTKHGGFDAVNANKQWMDILHEITAHFNPHRVHETMDELQSIYNEYLYAYEQIYFQSDLIDSIDDDFGDDLYLENDTQIINILTQYPLKTQLSNDTPQDPACYWLEMRPHGNQLRFMFANPMNAKLDVPYNCRKDYVQTICVSGSDKTDLLQLLFVNSSDEHESSSVDDEEDDDDEDDIGSILKSMVCHEASIIQLTKNEIHNHRDYINKDLCVCNIKGMHPYTRQLIHWMLNECESEISLTEIENISVGKRAHNKRKSVYNKSAENLFKLTTYEMDYILDVLILKVLRLLCVLNNTETSMMYAFEIGLNLLRKQYTDNKDGYSLYNGHYYIYYKRIISSFETFVSRAQKVTHNFLSHPKGLGIVCISSDLCAIKKDTFLSEIKGDLYAVPRWIEHSFCIENLYHTLLSGSRINYTQFPVVMDYISTNNDAGYNVMSVMNINHSSCAHINNKHWTSFLNHSCEANCVIKPFINKETNAIALGLFTSRNIVKGDELSINYNWYSSDEVLCSESICLCGLRECRGTYIAYKDQEIEDIYLSQNHEYISQRFVQLLLSTITPLNEDEKRNLDTLYLTQYRDEDRLFGDWMYKYLAFVSDFICNEYEDLPDILLKKIDRRNEYTLIDAQRDVNNIMLRRVRSLSICASRIKWYLKKQESLFRDIVADWKQDKIPQYIKLFGSEHSGNTMFVPPIRFAEIDEIIARLWNDEDSLINRLLSCLSERISSEVYDIIQSIVCKAGLMEESQYGLYLIRCKLVEIAQILSKMKCTKINRHSAAADILYLYANTYRFAKTQSYLSFASAYADVAVISHYRDIKVIDNRYLTRSVRKGTPPKTRSKKKKSSTNNNRNNDAENDEDDEEDEDEDDDDDEKKEAALSASERFIYSSSFPLICLLGWHHHDLQSLNGEQISKLQYDEYFKNMYGTALLPDIESCYDPNCKGLYVTTHRNYLFKCMLERKNWMKLSYTKQYEHQHDSNMINSCPVPQFTFGNKIGLFGSPVLDSYFDGFDNRNNQYIKNIVDGLQNEYICKVHK